MKAWWLLSFLPLVRGLGCVVPPVKEGDRNHYLGLKHLENCIGYPTVANDIVFVNINAGLLPQSQFLKVKVIDENNNLLLHQDRVEGETMFIFSNVNGGLEMKSGYMDQLKRIVQSEEEDMIKETMVYVCFDNIYTDKLWSFKPVDREVRLDVEVKTSDLIKKTNYQSYVQYFQALQQLEHGVTEDDFEQQMQIVSTDLASVSSNLDNSKTILEDLMSMERQLRDTNEQIFADFTKALIGLTVAIAVIGFVQVGYLRIYFKKKKLV